MDRVRVNPYHWLLEISRFPDALDQRGEPGMRQLTCLLLCLGLVSVAARADDKDKDTGVQKTAEKTAEKTAGLTDPVAILKKADAAAKAVKAVKYDVVVEGTGAAEQYVGKTKATIILSGATPSGPEKYLIDARVIAPGSTDASHITGGSDSDVFFVVRHAQKMAYEDIDPAVMGSSRRGLMGGIMFEFVAAEPFGDEINGKSQKLAGSKTIGGVDCYEIHVVYAVERAPEAIWYFSKKDFLPRGRIDKYKLGDDREGTVRKMVSNLVVNPKLDKDVFKLKLPKGYTKTDDFAP